MKLLGLIGKNISYSFSRRYFTDKFQKLKLKEIDYTIFDIQSEEEIQNILNTPSLLGCNITIPYKTDIIKYLDELSPEAEKIGAVNCVKIINDKKFGYNTDVYGFEETLKISGGLQHTNALILGDGGAAKAVRFVLDQHKIQHTTASRTSKIQFTDINHEMIKNNTLIIQCTPVGTFPNIIECIDIPYQCITNQHLAIDLIYNPEKTQFLKNCENAGAKIQNGQHMLEQQAEKSWEIWNKR